MIANSYYELILSEHNECASYTSHNILLRYCISRHRLYAKFSYIINFGRCYSFAIYIHIIRGTIENFRFIHTILYALENTTRRKQRKNHPENILSLEYIKTHVCGFSFVYRYLLLYYNM